MYLFLPYLPHAVTTAACGGACFIADCLTGTAFFQHTESDDMSTAFEPADPAAWDEMLIEPDEVQLSMVEPLDIDGWDDIDGLDIDGTAQDSELSESVSWLHSLLYSDYSDDRDDRDDVVHVNIPRSILDRFAN